MKMELSTEQAKAFDMMVSGRNVLLTGEGGTGKSYLVDTFVASLADEERQHTIICAPTGVAAQNVGGVTIHRTFGFHAHPFAPQAESLAKIEEIGAADRVIIDEISMTRFDVMEQVLQNIRLAEKKYNKHIQLIVIGDFYQLPPVLTEKDRVTLGELWKQDIVSGYAFQAPSWVSYDFQHIHLNQQYRQSNDAEYADVMNRLRKCTDSEEKKALIQWLTVNTASAPAPDAIILAPKNDDVDRKNTYEIAKLIRNGAESMVYYAESSGQITSGDKFAGDELLLCVGAQVMIVANDSAGTYVNGDIGTITGLLDDSVSVLLRNEEITIERRKVSVEGYRVIQVGKKRRLEKYEVGSFTQLPLKPAYALTIHKSQGKTFDNLVLMPGCFADGQLYVALSRARSASGVYIDGKLQTREIMTSPTVVAFMESGNCNTITPPDDELLPEAETSIQMPKPRKGRKKVNKPEVPAKAHTENTGKPQPSTKSVDDEIHDLCQQNHAKMWPMAYTLMKRVNEERLYLPDFPSIGRWLDDGFAVRAGKKSAIVRRWYQAGKIYDRYRTEMGGPPLETLEISPDNLVLAANIAGGDRRREKELVEGVISGALKRSDLLQAKKEKVAKGTHGIPQLIAKENSIEILIPSHIDKAELEVKLQNLLDGYR